MKNKIALYLPRVFHYFSYIENGEGMCFIWSVYICIKYKILGGIQIVPLYPMKNVEYLYLW